MALLNQINDLQRVDERKIDLCRPSLGGLLRKPREFNEFVTDGLETALGHEKIKKFLANLRPTNRQHPAGAKHAAN